MCIRDSFQLVPVMTVAENVILGAEVTRAGGYIDKRAANRRVRELSEQYGLEIDPTIEVDVGDLRQDDRQVGLQQRQVGGIMGRQMVEYAGNDFPQ